MKNPNKVLISASIALLLLGVTFLGYKLTNDNNKPLSDVLAADTTNTENTAATTTIDGINIDDITNDCPPELCGSEIDDGVDPTLEDPTTDPTLEDPATDPTLEDPATDPTDITQEETPPAKEECTKESWDCGSWKECSAEGTTTRTKACELKTGVDCEGGYKPAETASCTPPAPKCEEDTWSCGGWSACSAYGIQTRTCKMTFDCETADTKSPSEKESCTPPIKVETQVVPPVIKETPPVTTQENTATAVSEVEENTVTTTTTPAETVANAAAEATNLLETLDKSLTSEEKAAQSQAIEAAAQVIETQAQAKIQENLKQTEQTEKALTAAVENNPSFRAIFKNTPVTAPKPMVTDVNGNGVPDSLEGSAANTVDNELVQLQAKLKVQEQELVTKGGKSKAEAKAIVQKVLKTKMTEKRNAAIDKVALSKYKLKKPNQSERAAIILGVSPKNMEGKKNAKFSPIEEKLYGVNDKTKTTSQCSMSIQNGSKLSSGGFTVLAACPQNQAFNLVATDKNGNEVILDSKISSENIKTIFTVISNKIRAGKSVIQIKPSAKVSYFDSNNWHASVLNETTSLEPSNPVLVDVVEEKEVESPTVQNIENIEVAGISDIKVKSTADGKIRVTGLSDITTMVIGTFQSAVFTSAILADVSTGSFTVSSAKPLEGGDHEVVVYATKLDAGGIQSAPVKIKFNIVPTANAASGRIAGIKSPILSGILTLGAIILIGIGITIMRRKKKGI
ncbi:MAG: hypothetical protein WCT53_00680 [Candidatus Gracilibacteria bacterium]